jgi:hypothetical protein
VPRLELFAQGTNALAVHFGQHGFFQSGGLVDDGAQVVETAAAARLEDPQETVPEHVVEGKEPFRLRGRER